MATDTHQTSHSFSNLANSLKNSTETETANQDRKLFYKNLVKITASVLDDSFSDHIALSASIASILNQLFKESGIPVNWVGFYFKKKVIDRKRVFPSEQLVLGPFQGNAACTRIPIVPDGGVCSDCVLQGKPIVVNNVLEYPGHIGCDTDSRSEIVIPLILPKKPKQNQQDEAELPDNKIIGVLDIDSPEENTWSEIDGENLVTVCQQLALAADWD